MSEPPEAPKAHDETTGRWDVPINLLLPASRTLRNALTIDESTFRTHTFHGHPRAFFFWTVIDELEKVAMLLMRLDGFLDDPGPTPDGKVDSIERTAMDLVFEEVRLRARRLCETVTLLVLFAQTNNEAYFRHFLLLQFYLGGRWFNEELDDFHGAASNWVNRTLDAELADIHEVEKQVDGAAVWYAKYSFPLAPDGGAWRRIQTSQRERFKRALPHMRAFERMALGGAYLEAFGKPSASIHFSPGGGNGPLSGSVETELGQLGILAFCVASRCFELLGQPKGEAIEKIHAGVTSNEEAPRLLELLNVRPRIKVGDFVVARGLLGEVMEIAKSDYEYRSFRVLFLDGSPVPDLIEDWFRARDVVLFLSREKLNEGVKHLVGRVGDADDYRSSVRDAWQLRHLVGRAQPQRP